MLSTGVRTDIGFKIFGPNLDTLRNLRYPSRKIVEDSKRCGRYCCRARSEWLLLRYTSQTCYCRSLRRQRPRSSRHSETAIGGQNLGIVIEGRMRFPIRMRYQKITVIILKTRKLNRSCCIIKSYWLLNLLQVQ